MSLHPDTPIRLRRGIGRRRLILVAAALSIVALARVSTRTLRFYADDPIARTPESQDASGAQPTDIGLMFEVSYNLFVTSGHTPSNTRALNINTIDEVPDSSWFTNRIGRDAISPTQLARGPVLGGPPASERWTIIREKSAGVNPGFTAKDANGDTWFLAFDSRANPEGASGAVVVASKLFWALGFNQVEMFISRFDPAKAIINPAATKKRLSGKRTRYTRDDLNDVLERVARNEDGTYRVAAGRLLPGKPLGGFRYEGTRPDDPNDLVPHEHRRELRALRVFGAWTNLTDVKAGNTLDTIVTENGHAIVKHVLQDVGSTFGMANGPYEWDLGWEYFFDKDATLRRLWSFGFAAPAWRSVPYTEYRSIGRFEGERFDPTTWRPQTPTTAYMELRADDAFWAARRVMAFSDDLIRAAVHTGQYSDPAAEAHLAAVIGQRRDAIGRAYLPAVNPIVDPQLSAGGVLTFANAAVAARFAEAPSAYRATWSRFDNTTGATAAIGETAGATTTMTAPAGLPSDIDSIVEIAIAAESAAHASWREPVHIFFRRQPDGWKLVGLERLPVLWPDPTVTQPRQEATR